MRHDDRGPGALFGHFGEEIEDARRTVPRAILAAGAVITILYVATTLAVLLAMLNSRLALRARQAGAAAAEPVPGYAATTVSQAASRAG